MNKKSKSSPKVSFEELLKVLTFYAEKENYIEYENPEVWGTNPVKKDNGKKARKILKSLLIDYLEDRGIGK